MISIDAKEFAVIDKNGNLVMSMNAESTVVEKGYEVLYGTEESPISYNEVHENKYRITTHMLGNKRIDEMTSKYSIYELAEIIELAEEENEFFLFETTKGDTVAVRARDVLSIVIVKE